VHYRNRTLTSIALTLVLGLLPGAALVWYIDPFQIYHRPRVEGMAFSMQQRYQNAGFIHSYLQAPDSDYDSVIIGTSMSGSIFEQDVSAAMGWHHPMRLITHGGRPVEHQTVLQAALDTGRIRHVLLEVHPMFHFLPTDSPDTEDYFPEFLYNNNPLDDGPYLFNIDILHQAWVLWRGDVRGHDVEMEVVGRLLSQQVSDSDRAKINKPGEIAKSWQRDPYVLAPLTEQKVAALPYPQLDKFLVPVLQRYCNTDVEFVLHIATWPTLRYLAFASVATRNVYGPRHLLQAIHSCRNIRLHAFELESFAQDMNYFADVQHPANETMVHIINRMARKQNVLTLENVSTYEAGLIQLLNTYNPHTSYPAPMVFE
jgi:hypothetical protein